MLYTNLRDFFFRAYVPRRLITASPRTIEAYETILNAGERYLGRPHKLEDLTEDQIAGFLNWYSHGRSTMTVLGARKRIHAVCCYAHRKGHIKEVPDMVPIRQISRAPTSYSPKEIAKLLAASSGVEGKLSGVPAALFWHTFFLILYDTGARFSATWKLEWTDWVPPFLTFRAENQKQKEDQTLKVSRETMLGLESMRRWTRVRIFHWVLCRRTIHYHIKKIFAVAGLPTGPRDGCQRIRRTTATLMHNAGGDATRQLGHSSDAITRRYYLDPSDNLQAADLLPRPTSDQQRFLF
jgi:integrase